MKRLLLFLLFICYCAKEGQAQVLAIDSTRFVTGLRVGTVIRFAIPTRDKGILFVGEDYGNPGGVIPFFFDTGVNGNVLIGKVDSNHQIGWMKVYGGSDADVALSACETSDGGYGVLAESLSNDGNVTGNHGGPDIWLLRLDALGNLLWEQSYGGAGSDEPISIASTNDHGFILLGATNSSDGDVPFHYGDFFSLDWLVIKVDSVGNAQWSKDLGGTDDEGEAGAILSVNNSYYIISSSSSKDHDCIDTTWHAGVNTYSDIYILNLDTTGNVLWDSSYGGSQGDVANFAMYDSRDSTIEIVGLTGSSDYMVTGYHPCSDNGGDMWVVKADRNGNLIWQKTLGSAQEETGNSICVAPDGYMVYGSTFPLHCHDSVIGDIGDHDNWIFHLDNMGNVLANKIFGGVNGEDAFSIVPCLNGFAACGLSGSSTFTEGSCNTNYSGAFISYIDSWPLAVNNIDNDKSKLSVYPNPADENITVTIAGNKVGKITIINTVGQVAYKNEMLQPLQSEINVKEWSSGMYSIIWQGDNGETTANKFIKN